MPFENLIDLYTSSDVALITPVRDGMNLVAKEYVATRTRKDGVLVLSEMAGASIEMSEALLINPYNFEEIADTLKQALEMPVKEQKDRMSNLQKRISRYSVEKWADEFMTALDSAQNVSQYIKAEKLNSHNQSKIISSLMHSQNTLLLLDYDGTLIDFTEQPEEAKPDNELFDLLAKVAQKPHVDICITSGRDKKVLDKWFSKTDYRLISNHGVFYRKNKIWSELEILKNDWMEDVIPILETFVDRTPGSSLEQKRFSVAWHYRNADLDMAEKRVIEINTVLTSLISNTDLTIMQGNKVLEIKSSKVNKGRAALQVLNEKDFDNIIAFGDDWTDEYMFEDLPQTAHTIKVGLKRTNAKYYLNKVEEVRAFLERLAG